MDQTIFTFGGGLDLVTTAINMPNGKCISVKNYESSERGYSKCLGYERKDGRPAPSAASFWELNFNAGDTAITAGQTVTGGTSGASGVALYDSAAETGSFAGSDAAGTLVLYNVSGTFVNDEALEVSASQVATADGGSIEGEAQDDDEFNTRIEAVKAARRAMIEQPAGSGPIRGVHVYRGDLYCFRDNAGATAGAMFKATSSGWAEQTFGSLVAFDAGSAVFTEGETLTGGTSGATATIDRVVKMSGSWAGGTAIGYLVISSITGTFQNNETITDGSSGSATQDGTVDAISLPAGGKVRALTYNFYGAESFSRMYFVTSEGRAHEWDGSTLVPIRTGLSDALDKPIYIGIQSKHLLLGYNGGTLQYSGIGEPTSFNADDGAGEFGVGDDITGILRAAATASVIFAKSRIAYLTGTSSADFALQSITDESGAEADTGAVLEEPVYLDQQGVRRLSASDAFGDWKKGTITRPVQTFFDVKRAAGATPVAAHPLRSKDQYRLYYSDGEVLNIYMGRKDPEPMIGALDFTPSCVVTGEDDDGNELVFAGSSDGWVYQLEKGTSFDGGEIEGYIRFPWLHMGDPYGDKRFNRMQIDLDSSEANSSLGVAVEFSYGSEELLAKSEETVSVGGSGGIWEVSNWGNFVWGNPVQGILPVDLDGIGRNMSFAVLSDSATEDPHTLSSAIISHSKRKGWRS